MKRLLFPAAAMALVLASVAASAFDQAEVDELCARAGRNQGIFELFLVEQKARPGPAADGFTCSWSFKHVSSGPGEIDLKLTLEMQPVKSVIAARQEILLALLPENHRGKKVEGLSGMGDAAVQRTTTKDKVVQQIEIEALKDRRRFVFTATPQAKVATYRLPGQCINFLGSGLARLR